MKSIWKGAISFGLISIDVELNTAVQPHILGFTLLHDACKTPIKYIRECPACKQEVGWPEIVKGLEIKKDTYFILTQENIKKLKAHKTNSIDIEQFIDKDAIEPIFYEHHYYIIPYRKKITNKAYALLVNALEKINKIAIGTFVMKEKKYICSIRPYKNILLLSTLHYSYEIRPIPLLPATDRPAINPTELNLAIMLIKKLQKNTFNIKTFKDDFIEKLKQYVQEKGNHKKQYPKTIPPLKNDNSLLHALKNSLQEVKRPRTHVK